MTSGPRLLRVIAEHGSWAKELLSPIHSEMTQGPSDGRDGAGRTDVTVSRREQRVTLLARASHAIHEAHATAQNAVQARAAAKDGMMAALETHAFVQVELDAMKKLETDVRRFANALRAQGMPPEVAVRRLKATVDPVVYAPREHDAADVEWRRGVAGDVLRWFVEAYYAA